MLLLFFNIQPTPPGGSAVRFLSVKWYPWMWRWISQLEHLSQVIVKNAKSGFKSEITHFTSSVFALEQEIWC